MPFLFAKAGKSAGVKLWCLCYDQPEAKNGFLSLMPVENNRCFGMQPKKFF